MLRHRSVRVYAQRRPRVLWVSHETPDVFGQGGQRRQYRQIEALRDAGLDMIVLVPSSEQSSRGLSELVRVARTPALPRGTRSLARLVVLLLTVLWRPHAVVVAHAESFDLVRYTRLLPARIIVDFHNVNSTWFTTSNDQVKASVWRGQEREIARTAFACTVCSDKEAAALAAVTGKKPVVAPNGVAAAEWPDLASEIDRSTSLATFGSWWYEPNREGLAWFLSEVWPHVRAAVPDASLYVAGGGDSEGLIDGAAGVTALGRVPDLARLLAGVRVVVVPVLAGPGTPLKFGEALASGAAVVATPHAAASYDAAGVCSVQADALDFAASCVDLLTDSRLAAEIGERGRKFALAQVEWRQTTQPLLSLIQAAAAGSTSY